MDNFTYNPRYRQITGEISSAILLKYLSDKSCGEVFSISNLRSIFSWSETEIKRALSIIGQEHTLKDFEFPSIPMQFTMDGKFSHSTSFVAYKTFKTETSFLINESLLEEVLELNATGFWRKHMKFLGTDGFVYIIETEQGYKIGQTTDKDQRCSSVLRGMPIKGRLIHSIPTIDRHGLEKKLHTRYASKRIKGEWFNLNPEDIQQIRTEFKNPIFIS